MAEEECTAIVVDVGSAMTKVGYSGTEDVYVFPTVVGVPKNESMMRAMRRSAVIDGSKQHDEDMAFVGDECMTKTSLLNLSKPLTNGIVTSWSGVEKVWRQVFNVLRADPSDHAVLVSDSVLSKGPSSRVKITEMLFETFNVPAMHVQFSPVLCLYTSGKITGAVVELGDGVSQIMPVYEGYGLFDARRRIGVAGSHMTAFLSKILPEDGRKALAAFRYSEHLVRDIKERLCTCAEHELHACEEPPLTGARSYELPDGNVLELSRDSLKYCPELLFNSTISVRGELADIGVTDPIHDVILQCLSSSNVDDAQFGRDLHERIYLAGGCSKFPGLESRLHDELADRLNGGRCKVQTLPEPQLAAVHGGQIASSHSSFQSMWITKDMFEDEGAGIVHKLCF